MTRGPHKTPLPHLRGLQASISRNITEMLYHFLYRTDNPVTTNTAGIFIPEPSLWRHMILEAKRFNHESLSLAISLADPEKSPESGEKV